MFSISRNKNSSSAEPAYSRIAQYLGEVLPKDELRDEDLTAQFFFNPIVQEITNEMDVCAEIMLETYPFDLSHIKGRNRKIAYIYQNEEIRILQSMVSASLESGCSIRSLKHDALILNKRINESVLEDRVEEDTGYSIKLDYEVIGS